MSVANKKHQDILRPSLWGEGMGQSLVLLVSCSVVFLTNNLLS